MTTDQVLADVGLILVLAAFLRHWADTVLRRHYGGYELPDRWPRHIYAVWELSTLAAEWHRSYGGTRPT